MQKNRLDLRKVVAGATCLAEREEAVIAVASRDHAKNNGVSPKDQMSRGNFLRTALTITAIFFVFTSFTQNEPEYKGNPKVNERVIGNVMASYTTKTTNASYGPSVADNQLYLVLLEKAKKEYPNKVIDIRNLTYSYVNREGTPSSSFYAWAGFKEYTCSGKVNKVFSQVSK